MKSADGDQKYEIDALIAILDAAAHFMFQWSSNA